MTSPYHDFPDGASKPPTPDHWRICHWCDRIRPRELFRRGRNAYTKYCPECRAPEHQRAREAEQRQRQRVRERLGEDELEELLEAEADTLARRHAEVWIRATLLYTETCLPREPLARMATILQHGRWPRFKRWESGRAEPSHYDPTVSVVIAGVVFQ